VIPIDREPPFTAFRLTPKRKVVPVVIAGVNCFDDGRRYCFESESGRWLYPLQIWATKEEALRHVYNWAALRSATLNVEIARLNATMLDVEQQLAL